MSNTEFTPVFYLYLRKNSIIIFIMIYVMMYYSCKESKEKVPLDIYDYIQQEIGISKEQMTLYDMKLILFKRIDSIGLKYFFIEGAPCSSCIILEDSVNNKFYFGYGDEIYRKTINIYEKKNGIDDNAMKVILGNPLRFQIAHPIEDFLNDRYRDVPLDFATGKIIFDSLFLDQGPVLKIDSIELRNLYRSSMVRFEREYKDQELTASYRRYLLTELIDARDLSTMSYSYWYLAYKHSLYVVNVNAILLTSKHTWKHDKDRYCYVVRVKKIELY